MNKYIGTIILLLSSVQSLWTQTNLDGEQQNEWLIAKIDTNSSEDFYIISAINNSDSIKIFSNKLEIKVTDPNCLLIIQPGYIYSLQLSEVGQLVLNSGLTLEITSRGLSIDGNTIIDPGEVVYNSNNLIGLNFCPY